MTEISQILLVLLDSRCPLLHYPPSLHKYLATFRPLRKVIFVLTKIDITGPERVARWTEYLKKRYPDIRVVHAESYQEKHAGEGRGKRKSFEPHLPSDLRRNLILALKEAHGELCVPPDSIAASAEKLAAWKPHVKKDVDWDAVLSGLHGTTSHVTQPSEEATNDGSIAPEAGDEEKVNEEYLTIGLIGP